MSVSKKTFTDGMRQLGAAVNIVTTGRNTSTETQWAGLTATAVCSLSAEPPRLLCCVNQHGITFDIIKKSKTLAVNILAEKNLHQAEIFAGMHGDQENDRFKSKDWIAGTTEAPIFKHALVSFACTVYDIIPSASHAIILADVVHIEKSLQDDLNPLLYLDGRWGTFLPQSEG